MISGIGIDILQIKRIADMSKKMGWALAHQVLGSEELELYSSLVDEKRLAVNYLARRFSAKEAFVKACGVHGIDVRQVQILNHEHGGPYVHLAGNALKLAGDAVYHVSISDSDDYVVASVIKETR